MGATDFPAKERPNIVFILADDLGWGDLSIDGQKNYQTPYLDQLARDGIRFNQAYSDSPVCTPTRIGFFTGRYPGRLAIGNYEPLLSFQQIGDSEGSPIHTSYVGGAAAIAGANATILKAYFDEDFVIPNPVVPDPNDPTKVIPYTGEPLTVGGELNKLAVNYTLGRGHGGIHWRTDGSAGLALGEAVAIAILRDERLGYNEKFEGFSLTKFDGSKITV
ncbi:twin-arginine translocation pathway signal [Raphidiopsis curvata NIES-932]|nr:twin-arginine translocation pathway signal [Raphidiopsis curvata NIES-932]